MKKIKKTFKSFIEMIQGDPVFMRKVNGWLALFWIAMIPISLITGWISSVTYVAALSIWALVSGHWSAWQAARVEVEQQKEKKEDSEEKMIKRVVQETNVRRVQSKKKKGKTK
ncbi:MAG: hypothetical protein ABJA64_00245 [Candidatus Saccharibacteria bacterium]